MLFRFVNRRSRLDLRYAHALLVAEGHRLALAALMVILGTIVTVPIFLMNAVTASLRCCAMRSSHSSCWGLSKAVRNSPACANSEAAGDQPHSKEAR